MAPDAQRPEAPGRGLRHRLEPRPARHAVPGRRRPAVRVTGYGMGRTFPHSLKGGAPSPGAAVLRRVRLVAVLERPAGAGGEGGHHRRGAGEGRRSGPARGQLQRDRPRLPPVRPLLLGDAGHAGAAGPADWRPPRGGGEGGRREAESPGGAVVGPRRRGAARGVDRRGHQRHAGEAVGAEAGPGPGAPEPLRGSGAAGDGGPGGLPERQGARGEEAGRGGGPPGGGGVAGAAAGRGAGRVGRRPRVRPGAERIPARAPPEPLPGPERGRDLPPEAVRGVHGGRLGDDARRAVRLRQPDPSRALREERAARPLPDAGARERRGAHRSDADGDGRAGVRGGRAPGRVRRAGTLPSQGRPEIWRRRSSSFWLPVVVGGSVDLPVAGS